MPTLNDDEPLRDKPCNRSKWTRKDWAHMAVAPFVLLCLLGWGLCIATQNLWLSVVLVAAAELVWIGYCTTKLLRTLPGLTAEAFVGRWMLVFLGLAATCAGILCVLYAILYAGCFLLLKVVSGVGH